MWPVSGFDSEKSRQIFKNNAGVLSNYHLTALTKLGHERSFLAGYIPTGFLFQLLPPFIVHYRCGRERKSSPWLPRPKQRWSVSVEFSTGVVSLAMPAELLDEALRKNRQGPFRLPCNSQPPADSCATL